MDNEFDSRYSGLTSFDKKLLIRYVDQSIDAMQTGLFTYFAHPDLMNYVGDHRIYQKEMGRLCREAKACGIPLEYNLLGLAGKRHYPNFRFWETVAEEGCAVVLGRDAHDPAALLDEKTEQKARTYLEKFGLIPLDTVKLKTV